jgi:hypothetical protein
MPVLDQFLNETSPRISKSAYLVKPFLIFLPLLSMRIQVLHKISDFCCFPTKNRRVLKISLSPGISQEYLCFHAYFVIQAQKRANFSRSKPSQRLDSRISHVRDPEIVGFWLFYREMTFGGSLSQESKRI